MDATEEAGQHAVAGLLWTAFAGASGHASDAHSRREAAEWLVANRSAVLEALGGKMLSHVHEETWVFHVEDGDTDGE